MAKKVILFFLTILLSSCSHVFDSVKNINVSPDPVYKIGIFLPLSGKHEKVGKSILNTIMLAYNENPSPYVKLKIYNTKGDVNLSQQLAMEAINDGVRAIIGPLLREEAKIVSEVSAKNDIPVFTFSNDVFLIQSSSNLYTLSPLPMLEIDPIVDYMQKKQSSKNFAVMIPENQYGDLMRSSIEKSLSERGLNLVRYISYPTNTNRLTPFLEKIIPEDELKKYNQINTKLKNKEQAFDINGVEVNKAPLPILDFDTLIVADFGQRAAVIISHLPLIGIDTMVTKVVGMSSWTSPEIKGSSVAQKAFFASLNNLSDKDFSKQYYEYYKSLPRALEVAAYDSVVMLMALVYLDYEGNVVSDFTKDKITSIQGEGLAGKFIISNDRITRRNMSIKQIDRSATGGIKTMAEDIDIKDFKADTQ